MNYVQIMPMPIIIPDSGGEMTPEAAHGLFGALIVLTILAIIVTVINIVVAKSMYRGNFSLFDFFDMYDGDAWLGTCVLNTTVIAIWAIIALLKSGEWVYATFLA